jgi:hypothetical protein
MLGLKLAIFLSVCSILGSAQFYPRKVANRLSKELLSLAYYNPFLSYLYNPYPWFYRPFGFGGYRPFGFGGGYRPYGYGVGWGMRPFGGYGYGGWRG